jgi:hypothetical protein
MSHRKATSCSTLARSPLRQRRGHQHQNVDIGIGVQLAAAVATDGHQRQAAGEVGRQALLPQVAQQHVGEARARAHQALDRLLLDRSARAAPPAPA